MTGQSLKSGKFTTNQVSNTSGHVQWLSVISTPVNFHKLYPTYDFTPMIFSFIEFHIDNLILATVELEKRKQTKMTWKLIAYYCPGNAFEIIF